MTAVEGTGDKLRATFAAIRALTPNASHDKAFSGALHLFHYGHMDPRQPDAMSAMHAHARRAYAALSVKDRRGFHIAIDAALSAAASDAPWRRPDPLESLVLTQHIVDEQWPGGGETARLLTDFGDASRTLLGELGGSQSDLDLASLAVHGFEQVVEQASRDRELAYDNHGAFMVLGFAERLKRELVDVCGAATPAVFREFGMLATRRVAPGAKQVLADAFEVTPETETAGTAIRGTMSDTAPSRVNDVGLQHTTAWHADFIAVLEDLRRYGQGPPSIGTYLESARAIDRVLMRNATAREAAGYDAEVALGRLGVVLRPVLRGIEQQPGSSAPTRVIDTDPSTPEGGGRVQLESTTEDIDWAFAYLKVLESGELLDAGNRFDRGRGVASGFQMLKDIVHGWEALTDWEASLPRGTAPRLTSAQDQLTKAFESVDLFPEADRTPSEIRTTVENLLAAAATLNTIEQIQSTAEALGRQRTARKGIDDVRQAQEERRRAEIEIASFAWSAAPTEAFSLRSIAAAMGSGRPVLTQLAEEAVQVRYLASTAHAESGSQEPWRFVAERVHLLVTQQRAGQHSAVGLEGARRLSPEDLRAKLGTNPQPGNTGRSRTGRSPDVQPRRATEGGRTNEPWSDLFGEWN